MRFAQWYSHFSELHSCERHLSRSLVFAVAAIETSFRTMTILVLQTLESTQMASRRQLSVFCGYFILWLCCVLSSPQSHQVFKLIVMRTISFDYLWKQNKAKKEWKTILSSFIYQCSNRLGYIINLRNKQKIRICCQRIYITKSYSVFLLILMESLWVAENI